MFLIFSNALSWPIVKSPAYCKTCRCSNSGHRSIINMVNFSKICWIFPCPNNFVSSRINTTNTTKCHKCCETRPTHCICHLLRSYREICTAIWAAISHIDVIHEFTHPHTRIIDRYIRNTHHFSNKIFIPTLKTTKIFKINNSTNQYINNIKHNLTFIQLYRSVKILYLNCKKLTREIA